MYCVFICNLLSCHCVYDFFFAIKNKEMVTMKVMPFFEYIFFSSLLQVASIFKPNFNYHFKTKHALYLSIATDVPNVHHMYKCIHFFFVLFLTYSLDLFLFGFLLRTTLHRHDATNANESGLRATIMIEIIIITFVRKVEKKKIM